MPLFKRRQELKRLAEAEAQGESFWTCDFADPVRVKIWRSFERCASDSANPEAAEFARQMILDDEGIVTLTRSPRNDYMDFAGYFAECDSEEFASVIEALIAGLRYAYNRRSSYYVTANAPQFVQDTNAILNEHRISWEIVGVEIVPFESKEMHAEVVAPTLRLLAGRTDLADVEKSYQEALEELSKGDAGDAITDAGRALEEMLDHLGFAGNSLGARVSAAKNAGAVPAQDGKLFEWVAASRGNLSDAHPGTNATRGDAWLAVHVVGALDPPARVVAR